MKSPIRILSVEDDPLGAEWIRQTIEGRMPGAKVSQIRTESEFVARLQEISAHPPSLILMDVMLRWADPSPHIPDRPTDVKSGGISRAGLRCCARLAANPETSAIPVILYTVLQDSEIRELERELPALPPHVSHVQKASNPTELLANIRKLTLGG